MIQKFNKIYHLLDEYGFLNLIFYNASDNSALKFGGVNFCYVKKFVKTSEFKELEYPALKEYDNLEVVGLRELSGATLIKLSNDDIFQLTYIMDDETKPQLLFIFSKEANSSNSKERYDEVLKNFNNADDDIEIEAENE